MKRETLDVRLRAYLRLFSLMAPRLSVRKVSFREGLQQKSKACFIFFFFTVEVFLKLRVKNSEISFFKEVASF